ncbi:MULTISPECIES: zincin-like metallopeptidase domain-containing protein [unclassified Mesorhizobium]|uniref:ArdC family protein n=1 Tax=unclassified Mesorhizobium TaxID=325217 RepID=UPI001091A3DD|nr:MULTISPECIES: zincin-like metallopeptidase domain-containing protein [unclassified Mesorhizobium]TGQ43683.1 DUF1738 domain-containing protein [Mesorhizobium sp. M4B.F.Ca.ET.214.01.1.1]TGQ62498.1 DUF1738 domain-containing protein [Mesorhizobium sp. M4B.F.Ca.ET.211.01.1.1]TGU39700.1 DUF1738 domain-containing protein [Mesorhizobium sp. M4B.F.Ca.ET.150.01.1.1]TIX16174.1 MAG: DUF1738 domain-containing protein [Mesorhizobium sp.]
MRGFYRQITDAVLAQLNQTSTGTWICPWHRPTGGLPINGITGQRYRGANVLSLWCSSDRAGYADSRWATYRQWHNQGAQVRRGEKGTVVVFYKPMGSPDGDGVANASSDRRYVLRMSVAFNAEQCDGVIPRREQANAQGWTTSNFDEFVEKTGATIRFDGTKAYYSPVSDEIRLPARDCFSNAQGYAATLAHELIHWSGAKPRLARDLSGRFGDRAYAAEELIAELGAAFVLAGLGLASTPHQNHSEYIKDWLPLLREDPGAIFSAAAQASRAADWLFEITAQNAGENGPPAG